MDERIKQYINTPIPAPLPDDGFAPGDAQECGEPVLDITGRNGHAAAVARAAGVV